ncbi:MAG: tail-specific protease [Desulfobulbus propionicus]|nr:MAG: tail-specific protease [Desulfobulbus propionicus]
MQFTAHICSLFIWLTLFSASAAWAKTFPVEFDPGRNQVIAYILSRQLPAQHFSHDPLDNTLSQEAFALYIRQLDPRKRFLLLADVEQLEAFASHIGEELRHGRIVLPDAGEQLLDERIRQVQDFIDPLMSSNFDFNKDEYLETDPKKLGYAVDLPSLKDRWRKILKMQILDSYHNAVDKQKKEEKKGKTRGDAATFTQQIAQAKQKVKKRTHRALQRLLQETRQEHYNRYFDAVARSFDPHTSYMPPLTKEDFNIHMSGSLEGIGALLREEDGLIKVVRIIPGSAAEKQGQLQGEDTILAVSEKDGEPVEITDMRITRAVSYIRGPKGTEVRLTVQRPDGTRLIIPIVRDVVQIEETYVKSAVLDSDDGEKYGYIRLPSFYRDFEATDNGRKGRNVTDDTRTELNKLIEQGVKGIILDLRNNGGGALTDAVSISGLFLPGGPIVQIKDSRGMIRVLEDEDVKVVYDGPLIILVNQFSASASEILAAALQDYGRALIIGGQHTHGKGTVQAVMDMNRSLPLFQMKRFDDLGALKLTIQKFYRINGGSTQFKGVTPDIIVPSMLDYLKTGEQYLDNSLSWDHVDDVSYKKWQGDAFNVAALQKKASKWVSQNKQFQQIKAESAKAKVRSENTRASLSLEGAKQERLELEEARKRAEEAGLLNQEADNKDKASPPPLAETLKDDPFILVSRYLLESQAN